MLQKTKESDLHPPLPRLHLTRDTNTTETHELNLVNGMCTLVMQTKKNLLKKETCFLSHASKLSGTESPLPKHARTH